MTGEVIARLGETRGPRAERWPTRRRTPTQPVTIANTVPGELPIVLPDVAAFRADCRYGLSADRKSIPAKWLYDKAGSALFDRICALPEYYPYRVETLLLADAVPTIARSTAYGTTLVELGSGASRKTRILLDGVQAISTYAPIDINPAEVARATAQIRADYLGLVVHPIVADFTLAHGLAAIGGDAPTLAFFPGSTLGNMPPGDAIVLLTAIRRAVGPGGRLLLGIDLFKDEATLVRAYDDPAGVTAAFNLNLLDRINRELGGDVDVAAFRHRAIWNAASRRVEMHLVARRTLSFRIDRAIFRMGAGESIHTENSHKWSPEELERMFAAAGWGGGARWRSDDPAYLVALLDA